MRFFVYLGPFEKSSLAEYVADKIDRHKYIKSVAIQRDKGGFMVRIEVGVDEA